MDTLDQAVARLAPAVGTVRACRAVGQPRAGWYRRHRQSPLPPRPPRPAPAPQPRALQATERQQVLEVLHAERFWDQAPASVYATLLDEGLPGLDLHDVPAAAPTWRDRRPAPARHPPGPGQA
jgi:putative transposase